MDDAPTPAAAPAATTTATTPPSGTPPRRGFPASSVVFFAVAIVLGVLAVLLATGTIGTSPPPPPPPTPGRLTMIDVVTALRAQGLAAEIDPRSVRGTLSEPGQGVRIGDEPLYAFFFDDPEQARAEFAAADPAAVLAAAPARQPGSPAAQGAQTVGVTVTGAAPFVVQGSNVVVAMPGGDEETRAKVRTAIEGLPA